MNMMIRTTTTISAVNVGRKVRCEIFAVLLLWFKLMGIFC